MSNFSDQGWQPQSGNTTVKEKSKGGKTVIVDATLFWAELKRVNKLSGKYQVILGQLSSEDVDKLSDLGLEVKSDANKPERGDFITAKSGYEIQAFDSKGEEIHEMLANGSKAKAKLGFFVSSFNGQKYPKLVRLEVTELIPYTREDSGEEVQEYEAF